MKVINNEITDKKKSTNVMSRDAAAALICRLGCFTELEQSKALANVPTDLKM